MKLKGRVITVTLPVSYNKFEKNILIKQYLNRYKHKDWSDYIEESKSNNRHRFI